VFTGNDFIFDKEGFFVDIKTHSEYGRGEGKLHFIEKVMTKEGSTKEKCITIGGDDINDYWMIKEFRSFSVKPHLKKIKDVVNYDVSSLPEILSFL